ncbi:MAG: RIP metalloprotease RseP [Phycisphaerae bacterium]|nr:RIP metalloprotease RseP [Phycisphaerae bacterium]
MNTCTRCGSTIPDGDQRSFFDEKSGKLVEGLCPACAEQLANPEGSEASGPANTSGEDRPSAFAVVLVVVGICASIVYIPSYFLIFAGFSLVIFFHELGHFTAAKLCGVRVDKFAVGFLKELFGFRIGETRYSFNLLPLGGYVKMLGQEDFAVDKSGELKVKANPRAFTNKSVGKRMIIVSSGVIMNLVFAAIVFMITFMIGLESLPAEVGWIQPGSPAERVGVQVGDKITKVNGGAISDHMDLRSAVVLADPDEPLELTIERRDPASGEVGTHTKTIHPEKGLEQNILQIGVAPPMGATVAAIAKDPALPDDEQLQIDDEILDVAGRPIANFWDLQLALKSLRGAFADVRIRRPLAKNTTADKQPTTYEERTVKWRARMTLEPDGRAGETTGHLLGLLPRIRAAEVFPGQRAEQAGLQTGDVVIRWGNQIAPRIDEVMASIEQNPEVDIPVVVLRYEGGQARTETLKVRPKRTGWFKRGKPTIGVAWVGHETNRVVVADVVTEMTKDYGATPAAKLKAVLPRGAMITHVNERPIQDWSDLAQQFIELAGTEVRLAWSDEGASPDSPPKGTASFHVPHTLGTTFTLPGASQIWAINGMSTIDVETNGKYRPASVDHWTGAREILRQNVGKTITVEYWDHIERTRHAQEITITEEMVDPWLLRIQYQANDVITNLERILIRETNPAKAMMIGLRKTYHFICQVYLTMQRMIFTRSMDLDQMSGPVGIIKTGSDIAAAGIPELLFFLALISANLAVINFLPLPIFDGGLFVFLIIEKIKGSPISLQVQVATQVIGLALIIGIFLVVTLQDIAKLVGWG